MIKLLKKLTKNVKIQRSITQERLAEKSQLSNQHISNIENGNTKPSPVTIVRFANEYCKWVLQMSYFSWYIIGSISNILVTSTNSSNRRHLDKLAGTGYITYYFKKKEEIIKEIIAESPSTRAPKAPRNIAELAVIYSRLPSGNNIWYNYNSLWLSSVKEFRKWWFSWSDWQVLSFSFVLFLRSVLAIKTIIEFSWLLCLKIPVL